MGLSAGVARAQTCYWINASGGDFSTAANWSDSVIPDITDTAVFKTNGAYTVTLSQTVTNDKFHVLGGAVTLDLAGYSYILTNTSDTAASAGIRAYGGSLTVTNSSGTVGVLGSNTLAPPTFCADSASSTVIVTGAKTELHLRRILYIYKLFLVTGGAKIRAPGTTTTLQGGAGTLTVDGPGSAIDLVTAGTFIGNGATVIVTNGGNFATTSGQVGRAGPANAWVTGNGSAWTSGYFFVANDSPGNRYVTITNGGRMVITGSTFGFRICTVSTAYGRVLVTGTNSLLATTYLWINGDSATSGVSGAVTGILAVADGGLATISATSRVWTNGIIELDNGAIQLSPGVLLRSYGTIRGNGTFDLSTAGNAYAISNSGTISPGWPLGTLAFSNGNFTQYSDGELNIALGGIGAGQYSRLAVGSNAVWAGTLNVSLTNGFDPAYNDRFDILDWGAASGTFDAVNLPALSAPKCWMTNNLYLTGELRVSPPSGSVFSMH